MSPVQVTKRSHDEKRSEIQKARTVPLPLEIIFRPSVPGTYDTHSALVLEDDDTLCQFEFAPEPGLGPTKLVADPWLMREEFLEDEEICGMMGMTLGYGRFGVGSGDLVVPLEKLGIRFQSVEAFMLLNQEFAEWQSLVRVAMSTQMNKWPTLQARFPPHKVSLLCRPLALAIEWKDGRPVGTITCSGILEALIATLQIDALIGAEYRFCACVGCPHIFKVKRKDHRYCDDDCKHKQVVRNGRKRQSKAAKQSKIQNTGRKNK